MLRKIGREEQAKSLFEDYSSNFSLFIPEQLHSTPKPSVSPLCWSHSMLVIVAKELGYF